jgi:hypothetical protein
MLVSHDCLLKSWSNILLRENQMVSTHKIETSMTLTQI